MAGVMTGRPSDDWLASLAGAAAPPEIQGSFDSGLRPSLRMTEFMGVCGSLWMTGLFGLGTSLRMTGLVGARPMASLAATSRALRALRASPEE